MDTYDSGASPELRTRVTTDHDLTGVTIGSRATLLLEGRAVPAFGLARVRGSAVPRVSEGRLPAGRHEIVLGVQTLRDLGRSVGDGVTASTPDGPVTLRVVGSTTLPSLSLNGSFGLGEGAAVTAGALRSLDPAAQPSFFLVDLRPGVARRTVNGRYADTASTLGAQRPADIQSYDNVRGTPMLLAGLLAVLGAGVLAHLLVTSIRARRHDLAILKTLGLARRQVRATVERQATTLVAIALAIGIPIAFVAGRWTWQGFAGRLGVDDSVRVPALSFVVIAVAGGLLANLIAAVPARTAARTRPAIVLRSE
jgi:putative ABC transport system permease protein